MAEAQIATTAEKYHAASSSAYASQLTSTHDSSHLQNWGHVNWGGHDDPSSAFAQHFGHLHAGLQQAYRLPQSQQAAHALAVLSAPSAKQPKLMKPMRPKEQVKEIKEPKAVKQRPPKAPKSAYLCFEQERRRLLLEARPEKVEDIVKQHGDISRAVGRQWKALSAEEKKKWQEASQRDQQRYLDECKAMGIEPKLYPHIAGQVRIARPDRLVNGDCENLVDPLLMGVGRDQLLAIGESVASDGEKRILERPATQPDSKPLRWCARTRSFV